MSDHPTTPTLVDDCAPEEAPATVRPDPAVVAVNEADKQAERAAEVVFRGHDGYGSDDRAGYGAIAQVHATLALQAEVRALRETLAEVLGDLVATLEQRGRA